MGQVRYGTRVAIQSLPGKTVKPWKAGDERCHCTHCDLCGDLYRTQDIGKHIDECQEAMIAAFDKAYPPRCRHRNAMVLTASPGPGVKAERWCPECGAHYGPIYTKKDGWRNKRAWNAPNGPRARAYVALCEEVRATDKALKKDAVQRALKKFKEFS